MMTINRPSSEATLILKEELPPQTPTLPTAVGKTPTMYVQARSNLAAAFYGGKQFGKWKLGSACN